jgi:tetraacyldisaccharide 4'-kinase
MTPPVFWQHGHAPPWGLRPVSALYAGVTARRVGRAGWSAGVPVICCGNATAGGTGKTPLAIDLAQRLRGMGEAPAFLTRGHGGALRGVRVTPENQARAGDEPVLLAAVAPTYAGADRAVSARLAIAEGATVLVMDDGLQNPGLVRTLSLLVIDGGAGFGNGHVIPAGPLREPVAAAAARCQAAVLIGDDRTDAASLLSLPILRARLRPDAGDLAALPADLVAFAGIGRPQKFFDTLREAGRAPLRAIAFPDHHPYTAGEVARLRAEAARLGAGLVTTAKDAARLPQGTAHVLRVTLEWDDPSAITALLRKAIAR